MARFILRGNSYNLQQVDIAKSVKGKEPGPIRLYSVTLNSRQYPIKQVVSLATGVSVAEFTAHDAFRILKKLGFEIDSADYSKPSLKKGGNMSNWLEVWRTLRNNLRNSPRCPNHPDYPQVKTLSQGVVNDLIAVEENGIRVRSHRTSNEDYIEESRFKAWWDYLVENGSASLFPGHENNPHPWRSRVVGAIFAAGLPDRIQIVNSSVIELREGVTS